MSRTPPIAIGEHFARTGQPEKLYVVVALKEKPGFPLHVELQPVGGSGPILLGVSALLDRSLYQRVSNDP